MIWVLLTIFGMMLVLLRLSRYRHHAHSPEPGSTVGVWDSRKQTRKSRAALKAATDQLRSRGAGW